MQRSSVICGHNYENREITRRITVIRSAGPRYTCIVGHKRDSSLVFDALFLFYVNVGRT